MKLLDRIFGKSFDQPTTSFLQRFSNQVGSTPRPSVEKLLDQYADHTWVYACIQLIQSKGAGVPLKVYRDVNGKQEEVPNHKLQRLLETVNSSMTGYDLREATHGYIELTGECYWLPDEIVGTQPTKLYTLIPSFIVPKWNDTGLTGYEYRVNGKLIRFFRPDELIVFKTWNPVNPFRGLASGVPSRDVAEMVLNSDRYNAAFIKNGATAGGFLTSEKTIAADIKERILSAWNKLHGGPSKVNKVGILDGGLKWEGTSITHNDMQFTDLQKMSIRSLLAAYRIQPVMLGIHEDSNYSNATEQRRAFWIDSMIPRLRKIESVINERLSPMFDDSVYVAHDLSGVEDLQEDRKSKAERDQIYVNSGVLKINEIRAEQNLPPVPWGDTWNAPMGLMPIEDHSAPVAPGGEGDPQESEAPPTPPKDPKPAKAVDPEAANLKVTDEERKKTRDHIWGGFKIRTETWERRWFAPMRRLFSEQEREVIANLRSSDVVSIGRQARLDGFKNMKQPLDAILFDGSSARRAWRKEGRRLMELTLSAQIKEDQKLYGLPPEFSVLNPRVRAWLEAKAFKFADAINQTTEDALRKELGEAITAGESILDIEKRLESVFDIARGARTQMIARTEVISASNAGSFLAYKDAGVAQIEWVSSRDEKVRDEHQIDGEVVTIELGFSNGLKYPGDPSGEASNVINCRCTIAPVVLRDH